MNPNVLNMCLDSKQKRKILFATNKIKDYYLDGKKKTKKIKLFTPHKERVLPRFTIQMLFKATPSFHLFRA